MKKHILLFAVLACTGGALKAQLFNNMGATVQVESGAILHIEGAAQNQDAGANNGIINNVGLVNIEGDFTNGAGADLNLLGVSDYNVSGHWSNDGVVASAITAEVEFNGSANQNVAQIGASPGPWRFGICRVNTPSVTLSNDLEILAGGQLIFTAGPNNNIVNTGANQVTMFPLSTISGHDAVTQTAGTITTNYINGNLAWRTDAAQLSYDFPVGDATSQQFMNLTFAANVTAEIDQINGRFVTNTPPTPGIAGCGNSTVDGYTGVFEYEPELASVGVSSIASTTYRLTMLPHNYTLPASVEYTILVDHGSGYDFMYEDFSTPHGISCIQTLNPNMLQSKQNNTMFSQAAGGFADVVPFPVEMLPLTATPLVATIDVNWTTLTETNNSHFDVQRSLDGVNFQTVKAGVPGHGTTTQRHDYGYEDKDVQFGVKYYYRAEQFDFNGRSRFSNIAEAILVPGNDFSASFYPNPTDGALTLTATLMEDAEVSVKFYDAIGKLVVNDVYDWKAGRNQADLSVHVSKLAFGAYNAVVTAGDKVFTQKLVKAK